MNNRKCLFIDQYAGVAGGQVILLNLLASALDSGFSVTAAFPHHGELERRIKKQFGNRVQCTAIPEPRLNRGTKTFGDFLKTIFYAAYFLKLLPLLKQHDVIYFNGPRYFLAGWISSWLVERPFVYHIHLDHSPAEKSLIRRLADSQKTRTIIANSSYILERLRSFDERLAKSQKLLLIENSLSQSLSSLPFRDRFDITDNFHIAIVGRISEAKGQDILIELAPRFPTCSFFLIGEAEEPFTQKLRERLPENVSIHPPAEDIVEELDSLRIQFSVVSSRQPESFGMVAIEGMAASCITIVSGAGGLRDIAARTSCFVYDSVEGLAALLTDLLSHNKERLREIARQQFTDTKKEYAFEKFKEKIADVLNR